MKSELKVEYINKDALEELIQKAYFKKGQMGKLFGQKNYIQITPDDDFMYTVVNGLNNATIKVTNEELIDGSLRFIIDESDGVKIYPVSIYCINEDERYSFY